jgi:hypothetical protein
MITATAVTSPAASNLGMKTALFAQFGGISL